MNVITQSSTFAPSFKAPSLFSSKSAFKRPIQGPTNINQLPKATTLSTSINFFQIPEEKDPELARKASSNSDSEIIFMEPVKKLKTGQEGKVQMDCAQPIQSTKLTIEDVFSTVVKKENDEIFGDDDEEDCHLSFISSDDSLDDFEEKSVGNKNKIDEEANELQEEEEEKVVEQEQPVEQVEVAEPVEAVQPEETVEEVSDNKADSQTSYVHESPVNPANYYPEMRDYMAYNPSYNNLSSTYQTNSYNAIQQQYALLQQRMQRERERYSNYYNSEMLMAYNLSLNNPYNASNLGSLNNLGYYQNPNINYYSQYQQTINRPDTSYMSAYQQLQQLQLQQQMEQRSSLNRSTALLEESNRRAKISMFEESGDDDESYTTMCPVESANRDTADNSDNGKSQKEYSPLIMAGKEVQKEKELVGVKRPFVEEQVVQKRNNDSINRQAFERNNKVIKNDKPAKEASKTKKKESATLVQAVNPSFMKVERKLNRLQLLRYQQGTIEEGDIFFKQLEEINGFDKDIKKTNKALSQSEEEETEEDLRAVLPPFMTENGSQKGRKVKLLWTPESPSSEDLNIYIKKLEEVTESSVVSQQDAIKLLISNKLNVYQAIETASSNPEFYKELFRLKVKKTRGRRPVGAYVENNN